MDSQIQAWVTSGLQTGAGLGAGDPQGPELGKLRLGPRGLGLGLGKPVRLARDGQHLPIRGLVHTSGKGGQGKERWFRFYKIGAGAKGHGPWLQEADLGFSRGGKEGHTAVLAPWSDGHSVP